MAQTGPFQTFKTGSVSVHFREVLQFLHARGPAEEGRPTMTASSFRYDMKETCPSEAILRLYRTLGGEIITTGSDAHCPEHVAYHFKYAYAYLKSLGFDYITSFSQRKPSFHRIDE